MPGSARGYALRLLKTRLRSVWEIDQALARRGVEELERQAVIAELSEATLLDDAHFALAWLHTRDRLNPKGDWVLTQELRQKGIDQATIQNALRLRSQEAEKPPLEDLVERLQRRYARLPEEVRRRRILGYLSRRGFALGEATRILDA